MDDSFLVSGCADWFLKCEFFAFSGNPADLLRSGGLLPGGHSYQSENVCGTASAAPEKVAASFRGSIDGGDLPFYGDLWRQPGENHIFSGVSGVSIHPGGGRLFSHSDRRADNAAVRGRESVYQTVFERRYEG